MPSEGSQKLQQELHEVIGALNVLFTLREESAQWLDEAQNEATREALDNVLGHVVAMEFEYKRRGEELEKALGTRP